ncbi:hypothetical protein KOAAANKH_01079 [Brevundimonas sp. NIBR10]|uniref:type II toxin-antitoxin system Phd/YefM family antitoxin n=1 Tax=Brevundimonas sp. NIBR10 TaxID=3015997 RepID=UPI0022F1CA39|nr:type II toxin-antitoxin system Phd/YefM family antitoxin [Brevundimonas sp. NIBR10]WGM46211.1 hypothetical protein KOAAANKH_01079 [Brevundimonas sp. NIBR10]
MNWSLAKAKDNLSEVVRRAANEGAQTITVHGERAGVILSPEDYDRLISPYAAMGFKDLLKAMNFDGVDLTRDPTPSRDVEL